MSITTPNDLPKREETPAEKIRKKAFQLFEEIQPYKGTAEYRRMNMDLKSVCNELEKLVVKETTRTPLNEN